LEALVSIKANFLDVINELPSTLSTFWSILVFKSLTSLTNPLETFPTVVFNVATFSSTVVTLLEIGVTKSVLICPFKSLYLIEITPASTLI
jgi:hypothetical protein